MFILFEILFDVNLFVEPYSVSNGMTFIEQLTFKVLKSPLLTSAQSSRVVYSSGTGCRPDQTTRRK
jgi:hypothetical protein